MKKPKYTTIFSSKIKSLVSEDKDKYLAMASLIDIGDFIPEVDTAKDIDLLPIAFNACVVNRVNKNGDVINTSTSVEMYKNFINKPINIEHNRDKVVGVILTAGFSEFGTDKILAKEEVEKSEGPFNITLGGVIWKVVNSELVEIIENAGDPTSEDYMKVSASWELGFSDYNLIVLEGDEKNTEKAKIITEADEISKLKPSLKGFGGSGKLEDGRGIYRQVTKDVVPLGIGLTEKPAADVKGIAVSSPVLTEEVEKEKENNVIKTQNTEENSSQLEEKNVTNNKELIIMHKINSIKDITDESLTAGELKASVISDFIENELQEASQKFAGEKQDIEEKLKTAEEEQKTLAEEGSKTKEEFELIKKELEDIKADQKAKAAEDKFNQRMASFDETYELDDAHRGIIAGDIKDMNDEDFEAYSKKMEVLLSRQKYGGNKGDTPDADRKKKGHYGPGQKKKETADEEGEEDDKKLPPWLNKKKKSKAEEETEEVVASSEAEQVIDEAVENAEMDKTEIPTTTEASTPTTYDKYKQAFDIREFEINY